MVSLSLLAGLGPTTVVGLPGSSADLSACAVPFHPGRPARGSCSLLALPWQASPLSGGIATSISVTRPIRVRLRYGSRVRSPGLRRRDYSRRRPVRYLLNEQFARQPPFRLQGPPGLSWRSRDAETQRKNLPKIYFRLRVPASPRATGFLLFSPYALAIPRLSAWAKAHPTCLARRAEENRCAMHTLQNLRSPAFICGCVFFVSFVDFVVKDLGFPPPIRSRAGSSRE
jgi:hypothetical protein